MKANRSSIRKDWLVVEITVGGICTDRDSAAWPGDDSVQIKCGRECGVCRDYRNLCDIYIFRRIDYWKDGEGEKIFLGTASGS